MSGIVFIKVMCPKTIRKILAETMANQCVIRSCLESDFTYNYLVIKKNNGNLITLKGSLEEIFDAESLNNLEVGEYVILRHSTYPYNRSDNWSIILYSQALIFKELKEAVKFTYSDIVICLKNNVQILTKTDFYLRHLEDNLVLTTTFFKRGKNMKYNILTFEDQKMFMEKI